jgi:hypothetical protein
MDATEIPFETEHSSHSCVSPDPVRFPVVAGMAHHPRHPTRRPLGRSRIRRDAPEAIHVGSELAIARASEAVTDAILDGGVLAVTRFGDVRGNDRPTQRARGVVPERQTEAAGETGLTDAPAPAATPGARARREQGKCRGSGGAYDHKKWREGRCLQETGQSRNALRLDETTIALQCRK